MLKYYVNLPIDASKHHGNEVTLEATADGLTENDVALSEWWVEGKPNNTDLKYLKRMERARPKRKYVVNQKDKFRNTVSLPHVGGDEYIVKCSKKGDRSTAKVVEEIETWRKIFYTVHYMNNDCLTTFNAVKGKLETAFAEGFVEMSVANITSTKLDEAATLGDDVTSLYDATTPLKDKPFHLRIVVLNDIYDHKEREYSEKVNGASLTQHTFLTAETLSDKPNTPGIKSVKVEIDGRKSPIYITSSCTKVNSTTVMCDFSNHSAILTALKSGKDITITLKTNERDPYLGFSLRNLCVVTRYGQSREEILQTFTHEIGHGLQQVVKHETTYSADGAVQGSEDNPKWHYNEYGGQGPHCSTNAKLVADTRKPQHRTSSGKIYVHDSGTLCTMFFSGESHVDRDGKFCANCLPRLKRVKLSAAKMKARGWDKY